MGKETLKKAITELESLSFSPELIQDNKICFSYNNEIYRVRMPNQRELMEADRLKNEQQVLLLKQENTLTKKQLKNLLKDTNKADIDLLEKKLEELGNDLCEQYLLLAKVIDADTVTIKKYEDIIKEIKESRYTLLEEISNHLSPAIENQVEGFYMSYLTSVCTEKHKIVENKVEWFSVWSSFDEYLDKAEADLSYYAICSLTKLIMHIRQ
jgi:hypothetical protein